MRPLLHPDVVRALRARAGRLGFTLAIGAAALAAAAASGAKPDGLYVLTTAVGLCAGASFRVRSKAAGMVAAGVVILSLGSFLLGVLASLAMTANERKNGG